MKIMQRDAANTCPYTGGKCNQYGSGYCSYECPNNPDYEEDEDDKKDSDK